MDMSDVTLDTRCTVPPDVIFRELEDEAIILNLDSGIYFGLDPVGTRMWQLLVEAPDLRAVHARMLAEFDTTADVLEHDILAFAATLREKGLVTFRR